jgi:uncharacterized protein involved in exopolysaccharide biosynthesis
MTPVDQAEAVTLRDLWRVLWRGRWLVIGLAAAFVAVAVAYVLIAAPWYEAKVLLAPAEERTTEDALAGLGGLVGLAGISVGGQDNSEAIAIIESRDFTRAFIQERNLMPVLFADKWDEAAGRWKAADPADAPEIREAVRFFSERVRRVEEDKATGLVTLTVTWKDPALAANWANDLVERLNAVMRERALADAQRNFDFLQKELAAASIVTLQLSIGRLLDAELQKLMLARGNEEFAFRVLDHAEPPDLPSRPRRVLLPVLMCLFGGVLGVAIVTIRHSVAEPAGR